MTVYRTNNPMEYDQVDGIVIDERAPTPRIRGVGTNVAILVGKFERGPENTLIESASESAIYDLFGENIDFEGIVALSNKRFSRLKIIRVAIDGAVAALLAVDAKLTFTAKYKGAYGNNLSVTVEDGTNAGTKKYTIKDTGNSRRFQTEVYDNIAIANINAETFRASRLVNVTVQDSSAEPANQVETRLATGSNGTEVPTDYETAIAAAAAIGAGNILFLDEYDTAKNGYLRAHAARTQDKICILAGGENDTVAQTVTAVGTLRDTDGRLIYAENWLQTAIGGVNRYVSPASFLASILSQSPAHIDPAFVGNTGFLFGVSAVKNMRTRAELIQLVQAGVAAFEFDPDTGFKLRSGVTTQIADSSKVTILRRRMADYLTNSIGRFLKNYQNAVNSVENREAAKAAIMAFIQTQEDLGILPKDSDVRNGRAKDVDIDTLNTDENVAAGRFFIQYRQRIFSAARFIVLIGEIGESVVVREGA